MTIEFAHANFKTGLGTLAVVIALPKLNGATPKVALFFMTGRTDAGGSDGAGRATIFSSIGARVLAGGQRAIAWMEQDAVTPTSVASQFVTNCCMSELSTAGVSTGRLQVTDMTTPDQITVAPNVAFSQNYQCFVAVWGGSSLTDISLFDFALTAGAGSQNVTNPGFIPKYTFFFHENISGGLPQGPFTGNARPSCGEALPNTAQNHTLCGVSIDNVGTSDTATYANSTECISAMSATGAVASRVAVSGTTPGGFVLNKIAAGNPQIACLALGGDFQVAFAELNSTPPVDGSISLNVGFDVKGGLCRSGCYDESGSSAGTTVAGLNFSLGGFTGPQATGTSGCVGEMDADAVVGSTTAASAVRNSDCYVHLDNTGAVIGAVRVDTAHGENPGELFFVDSVTDPTPTTLQMSVFGDAFPAGGGAGTIRGMIEPGWMIPVP